MRPDVATYLQRAVEEHLHLTTHFMGHRVQKLPNDLWVLSELIWEIRPTLLIETGTAEGGSALYYATLMDAFGIDGQVVTIDIAERDLPQHPRVRHICGYSSTEPSVVAEITAQAADAAVVMVILDSDHRAPHVLHELRAYAPLVTPGSILIVEDTVVNGHPFVGAVPPFTDGPGPTEALEVYMATDTTFQREAWPERYEITYHPGGFWRRIACPHERLF